MYLLAKDQVIMIRLVLPKITPTSKKEKKKNNTKQNKTKIHKRACLHDEYICSFADHVGWD